MQDLPAIRTPLMQQWRRMRYQLAPVLVVTVSMVLTGWLWNRHAGLMTGLGEIDTSQRVVMCPTEGVLLPLQSDQSHVELYDRVEEGQLIARYDDTAARRSLELMQLDLSRMQLDIAARTEQLRVESSTRREDRMTEARRLANKVDTLRLQILEYKNKIEVDKLELKRLDAICAMLKATDGRDLIDSQHKRDVVQQKIRSTEAALAESEDQLKAALKRTEAHANTPEMEDVEKQMQPVRSAIATQEKKLAELQTNAKAMEIRSPFRGRIVAIHRWPGEFVHSGEPLVTIAKEEGSQIKCYIRQEQRINPTQGMQVEVRRRMPGSRTMITVVERVGPQVEQVPAHLLRNPREIEWGIPVHIAMPQDMEFRPGELVDLKFVPNKQS